MCGKLSLILFLLSEVLSKNQANFCGQRTFSGKNGTIRTNPALLDDNFSCLWTVNHPYKTITTVRILQADLEKCSVRQSCCLTITNEDLTKNYIKLCNETPKTPIKLSIRGNKTLISLETSQIVDTWIHFSTRENSDCRHFEFQCYDKTGCYNSTDNCKGDFVCNDHSDKIDCGDCPINFSLCNRSSKKCFDPIHQRCDGVIHCPEAEDELGCSELCPNLIKCPDDNKCINQNQICDQQSDCSNNYDEQNCSKKHSSYFSIVFVISSLCSTCFMCIIFHWISSRRHSRRFLNNPPDFPLAPFEGPGDQEHETSSSEMFTDSEFRQGGGIYESYFQTLKKTKPLKSIQSMHMVANREKSYVDLDGDNELIVLASLNVPVDMCVGLSLSNEKQALSEALIQQRQRSTSKMSVTINSHVSGGSSQSTEIQCINENPKQLSNKVSEHSSHKTYTVTNSSEWTDIGETTGSSTGIIFVKSACKISD